MDLKDFKLFDKSQNIVTKDVPRSERDDLVSQICELLTLERKGTKYEKTPVSKKVVAIRLNKKFGGNNFPLYQILSIGKDKRNRGGSFSTYFWWRIRPEN